MALYTGERLLALQVLDAPHAGCPDLPDEWQLLQRREDDRGEFYRATFYPSARAAVTAAQRIRAEDNPAARLVVFCPHCVRPCGFLGGFICPDCLRGVGDA